MMEGRNRNVPTAVRLKQIEKTETLKNYLKHRKEEGFNSKYERNFKAALGIKMHIDTEEYLRKFMNLKRQEIHEETRFTGDIDNDDLDDKDDDAESYVTEMFVDRLDSNYIKHLLKLKDLMRTYLNPLWYYGNHVKYIFPQCTPEHYLPITISNLSSALSKFKLFKQHLVYNLRNYMRPGFLDKMRPPKCFEFLRKKKKKTKRSRPTVRTGRKRRHRRRSHRRRKPRRGRRPMPTLKQGELTDEMVQWKRNVRLINKIGHKPPRSGCIKKGDILTRAGRDPAFREKPQESKIEAELELYELDPPLRSPEDVCDTTSESEWYENPKEDEVDDEEEIAGDSDVEETEVNKPIANNLLKAIFKECADDIKKLPRASIKQDRTSSEEE